MDYSYKPPKRSHTKKVNQIDLAMDGINYDKNNKDDDDGLQISGGNNTPSLAISSNMLNTMYLQNKFPAYQPVYLLKNQNIPEEWIPTKPFDKLKVPCIFLKQKIEILEILAGCETENKFKIYACDFDGEKLGQALYEAREKSTLCSRWCLTGDCRPFVMYILHNTNGLLSNDGQLFLRLERPCAFTFLCLNRPFVEVSVLSPDNTMQPLGKILHEFDIKSLKITILNTKEELLYTVRADIFQIGFWVNQNLICDTCQKAFIYIYDAKGEKVGLMEKRSRGLLATISDADNFSINFPIQASLEDRALLLASSLMIDYRYFEHNSKKGYGSGDDEGMGGGFSFALL